jgi:hypothetical protein
MIDLGLEQQLNQCFKFLVYFGHDSGLLSMGDMSAMKGLVDTVLFSSDPEGSPLPGQKRDLGS